MHRKILKEKIKEALALSYIVKVHTIQEKNSLLVAPTARKIMVEHQDLKSAKIHVT
jgi:hypothetical protein